MPRLTASLLLLAFSGSIATPCFAADENDDRSVTVSYTKKDGAEAISMQGPTSTVIAQSLTLSDGGKTMRVTPVGGSIEMRFGTHVIRTTKLQLSTMPPVTTLELQNLAFCSEVRSFGQFDRLVNPSFVGGEDATLYLEVQNFSQKKLPDTFEINLVGNVEILDEKGAKVHTRKLPADRQQFSARKHDHFIAYRLSMPSLPPGRYDLKVNIRDTTADIDGSATIPFVVASEKR